MEPNQTQQTSGFKAIYGVIIAILALGGGFLFWNKQNNKVVPLADTTATTKTQGTGAPIAEGKKKYFDGTYTATGSYVIPDTKEEISITLVIKDDIVTNATFSSKTTNDVSKKLQGMFNDGFKTEVVGKPLSEISLTVVNGSSLTPKGFMDALEKIKVQAQTKS